MGFLKRKLSTIERRKQIAEIMNKQGIWCINKTDLANKLGVSRKTIYNDIHRICENASDEDISEISFQLRYYFKELLSISQKYINSEDGHLAINAVRALTTAIDTFTRFLESFGYKKPVDEMQKKPLEFRLHYVNTPEDVEHLRKLQEQDKQNELRQGR